MCEGVSVWFRYRNICGSVRSLHCSEASLGGERIYGFKSFTLEYRLYFTACSATVPRTIYFKAKQSRDHPPTSGDKER